MELCQTVTNEFNEVLEEKTDIYKMSMSQFGTAIRRRTGWISNQMVIDLKRHGTIIVQRGQYKLRLEIKNAGEHKLTGRTIDYTAADSNSSEGS